MMRASGIFQRIRTPFDRLRVFFPSGVSSAGTEGEACGSQESNVERDDWFRVILETTHEAFVAMDEQGRIIDWNPQAEILFGYSRDEAIGSSVADTIIPERYREAHWRGLSHFLETGEGPVLKKWLEMPALRRSGDEFIAELAIAPLFYDGRHYFAAFLHDISPRKKAEAERNRSLNELRELSEHLRRSNEDLERFAYAASHDLKEPLRTIGGCLQILLEDYGEQLDSRAEDLVCHSIDGVQRMQALIHDLLTYSRLTTRPPLSVSLDCEEIVDQALEDLTAAIQETDAVVTREPLPVIEGDEARFLQLFQNLISNGIKYVSGRAPEVHLGCRPRENEWLFSVSDNGIGIEPEYFEKIFGLFQRLHTRREYPGTGLGLAICKRIVEQYGGRIWVESEPGRGSTFYFTLPRHEEEGEENEKKAG